MRKNIPKITTTKPNQIEIIIITIRTIITIPFPESTTNIQKHHFKTTFVLSKVYCGSAIRFGQALPGFLITAHHLCPFLI